MQIKFFTFLKVCAKPCLHFKKSFLFSFIKLQFKILLGYLKQNWGIPLFVLKKCISMSKLFKNCLEFLNYLFRSKNFRINIVIMKSYFAKMIWIVETKDWFQPCFGPYSAVMCWGKMRTSLFYKLPLKCKGKNFIIFGYRFWCSKIKKSNIRVGNLQSHFLNVAFETISISNTTNLKKWISCFTFPNLHRSNRFSTVFITCIPVLRAIKLFTKEATIFFLKTK